ncbi:hypothetical protein BC938DRAFT_481193 [Jimgerdemannia flammicorona]|uniref:C3H1-type domain-containing protein n=1 Tax=Jimgerdemannia flammicorona TaxID=994334 RepID=A0A433QGR0_9FUNG|nr:hypothetical protein BC938DRAFT_481193 [Jimgerdemannia flammicorona]
MRFYVTHGLFAVSAHSLERHRKIVVSFTSSQPLSMPICKFFLQDRCSFGVNCRNEHRQPNPGEVPGFGLVGFGSSGGGSGGGGFGSNQPLGGSFGGNQKSNTWGSANISNNRFSSYSNTTGNQAATTGVAKGPAYNEQTMQQDLTRDRPEWRLSVYAPGKEEPNIITGADRSPEEDRVSYYMAAQMGTQTQYVSTPVSYFSINYFAPEAITNQSELGQASSAMEQQVNAVLNNLKGAIDHVQRLKSQDHLGVFGKSASAPPPFTGGTSTFGNLGGGSAGSFGTTNTLPGAFGQSATTNTSPFGASTQPIPQSTLGAFGQTTTNIFGGNPPAASSTTTAFGQPSTLGGGLAPGIGFGSNLSSKPGLLSVFGTTPASSAFGSSATSTMQGGVFGQPAGTFGLGTNGSGALGGIGGGAVTAAATPFGAALQPGFGQPQQPAVPTVGTDTQDLSHEEIQAFMAQAFEYKKVPETEPPMGVR